MKPILFSTPMVQAIMEGRKTQTRRIVKGAQNDWELLSLDTSPAMTMIDKDGEIYPHHVDGLWATFRGEDWYPEFPMIKSRYEVGDILYVRETWCKLWHLDSNGQTIEGTEAYYYAADGYNPTPFNAFPDEDGFNGGRDCPRWRPSIHMPREAARLFLRVTDVRVERLQEITVEGCIAEGMDCDNEIRNPDPATHESIKNWNFEYARFLFHNLWDTLNAKRGYGWDTNPWVWVYTFEVISKEEATATEEAKGC